MDGDMRVKVADFGMARDMHSAEYYRLCHKSRLPVKWMAPESFHDAKFSSKTDVVSWKWVLGLYFFCGELEMGLWIVLFCDASHNVTCDMCEGRHLVIKWSTCAVNAYILNHMLFVYSFRFAHSW